jgi:hypothetical protein
LGIVKPQSAFRANGPDQIVNPTQSTKVLYPNEVFDLNNEYDPLTSTFTPVQDGVYTIIASVNFLTQIVQEFFLQLRITVNGTSIARDTEYFNITNVSSDTVISVSTIFQLQAGEEVEVFLDTDVNGFILGSVSDTHFEAARHPSPSM